METSHSLKLTIATADWMPHRGGVQYGSSHGSTGAKSDGQAEPKVRLTAFLPCGSLKAPCCQAVLHEPFAARMGWVDRQETAAGGGGGGGGGRVICWEDNSSACLGNDGCFCAC